MSRFLSPIAAHRCARRHEPRGVHAELGKVQMLVNNAGMTSFNPLSRALRAPAVLPSIAGGIAGQAANSPMKRPGRPEYIAAACAFLASEEAGGSLDTWDFLYAINLKTALCACNAALAHLPADNGRIVNVVAAAAAKAGTGMGARQSRRHAEGRLHPLGRTRCARRRHRVPFIPHCPGHHRSLYSGVRQSLSL